MNLVQFIRLIIQNSKFIVVLPIGLAALVFVGTRGEPKSYSTRTLVYTGLASGYTLESGANPRFDNYSVSNAFDNLINTIKAEETIDEVAIRLLAKHLSMPGEDTLTLTSENYQRLAELIPESLRKSWNLTEDEDENFKLLWDLKELNPDLRKLLYDSDEIYSRKTISSIKPMRQGSSDMVEIKYGSNDPGVCKYTLDILIEVFTRNYKTLKQGETGNVVKFFEEQTKEAQQKLLEAENRLKAFGVENQLINYVEQSRQITSQKQKLEEEYHSEKMKLAAADSALSNLEKKMGIQTSLMTTNKDILEKKQKIARISSELVTEELKGGTNTDSYYYKKEQIGEITAALNEDINRLYNYSHSREGISKEQLLDQWLTHVLAYSEGEARVKVLEDRINGFQKKYIGFAPLGSALGKIEREVNIAEKEYLDLLHSLNLSKLREQNIKISTNIQVLDPPFFPVTAEPSKAKLMVVAAWLAGTILCIGVVVALEFLDQSIRSPNRAIDHTKLKLFGALPVIMKKKKKKKQNEYLAENLTKKLITNLKLDLTDKKKPYLIISCSHFKKEGKTLALTLLTTYLKSMGKKVISILPETVVPEGKKPKKDRGAYVFEDFPIPEDSLRFTPGPEYLETGQISLMAPKLKKKRGTPDYILLEVPPLFAHDFSPELFRSADRIALIVSSTRIWIDADEKSVDMLTEANGIPPGIILNGVKPERLDEILGEVRKERSWIRSFIKRLATFNFRT